MYPLHLCINFHRKKIKKLADRKLGAINDLEIEPHSIAVPIKMNEFYFYVLFLGQQVN